MFHLALTALLQVAANNPTPFEWIYQHMMLIGWPTICYGIWRVTRFVDQTTHKATKAVQQIDKMATNCFPTMQRSLETQDILLTNIDRNIEKMADKL